MNVKEYKLYKTAKKTAEANKLELAGKGRNKKLFDFSLLDTLDISEDEKNAIKAQSMEHCDAVAKSGYITYEADWWTICNVIADFNCHQVYDANTFKRLYIIMEAKRIKYNHAERQHTYDQYYRENVRQFDLHSKTDEPFDHIEI